MELEVINGNYAAGKKGGLSTVEGQQEIIQRIMMRLAAHRGAFYPAPDFGSRLYTLLGMKPGNRHAAARQFVHEALEDENVEILEVQCCDAAGGTLVVKVWLDISGRNVELSIRV